MVNPKKGQNHWTHASSTIMSPSHWGRHEHEPAEQVPLWVHAPQLPPQPSAPQTLPSHWGTHSHWPPEHPY